MHAAINTADLDPLGNWSDFDEDADGDSTDDLTQSRTTNAANEITDITEGGGQTQWFTPVYDRSGNMIEIPQPSDPANEFDATYDAWGRLVKLEDGANTVAEYEYDGLGRRIIKHVFDAGTFDYSDHAYYTGWQVVEVRRDTDSTKGGDPDADPMEQLVYHPYYIDAVAVRYWDDPDDGGGLDGTQVEQYYAHDAQFNVIALLDDTGDVIERYRYAPYGEQTVMDASYSVKTGGTDYAQYKGFTGQTLDPESGLWYFRSRYYSDGLGSFISADSKGYIDGMNLRASYFAMRNRMDPMGREATDEEFERITGVGDAIADGRLSEVEGVHGETFTASNCMGREGCDVEFEFTKAYVGRYTHGRVRRELSGAYVKISASIRDRARCCCDSVYFVQVVANYTIDYPANYRITMPDESDRRLRSGADERDAPSRGWRVDASPPKTSPIWGVTGFDGNRGTQPLPPDAATPAELWDPPGGTWVPHGGQGKEFVTCAICEHEGEQSILACVRWGFYVNESGRFVTFTPNPPRTTCSAPQEFRDALERWNNIDGMEPLDIENWGAEWSEE